MCGGTTESAAHTASDSGLSPRVRGNPPTAWRCFTWAGSIPACAGEPTTTVPGSDTWEVYPRVCGGTRAPGYADCYRTGLSPRVRGNPQLADGVQVNERSIPACAGEPAVWGRSGECFRVYPRVCGGTTPTEMAKVNFRGLSPRVRGNHPRHMRPVRPGGSIPACAGEPGCAGRGRRRAEVYPRVCGGTYPAPNHRWHHAGLSPRVRGNHEDAGSVSAGYRSIPACAGEPPAVRRRRAQSAVYPRVCGGTWRMSSRQRMGLGLSPRVRGNLAGSGPIVQHRRSIPACAGEPGISNTRSPH